MKSRPVGEVIKSSEVPELPRQPILALTIHGLEAEVVSRLLQEVEKLKGPMQVPREPHSLSLEVSQSIEEAARGIRYLKTALEQGVMS